VERSIANSMCVGVFHRGDQVGFARVVSDLTIFAYLCDVYVLEEHRGRGLASWMLEAIAAHPDLQGLRRFILATRDAHKLYEKHGFTPVRRPESLMEILKQPAYARPAG
jgi:GNAT superfamily N-acetyltransferase